MRISQFPLVVLFLVVVAVGCDSAAEEDPIILPPEEIEGSMSAAVSGKAFEADSLVSAWFIGTNLLVEGTDSTGRSIRLALRDAESTGTYVIEGLLGEMASAAYHSSTQEFLSQSDTPGTLNLTRLDSLAVRGTFQFTAASLGGAQVIVEQGQFLAPLVEAPQP